MSIADSKRETIWYLEMGRLGELKPKSLPKDTQIIKFGIPLPAMNRFFYLEVGRKWQWTERKSWTEDQWNEVLSVNLNSNFHIIKSILPNMIKNRFGKIIGISSVVALTGNPGQANYTASKAAIISMYKSLAIEVAQRNICINLIAPGFIQSPMTDILNEDQKNLIMEKIPMKRFGLPKDIANLAIFLASDNSSYITGQTFHVNGGMLMV